MTSSLVRPAPPAAPVSRRAASAPARVEAAGWRLALALAGLASTAYAAGAVFRYDRFAAGAYDLGIFDQAVWGYSRFELVPNTVKGVRDLLGDHFHPIVALAAPLYWVWADPRALLLLQAVLLGASALPLYAFARRRLDRRRALLAEAVYLAFVGVWSAAFFDFHEVAFAAPLLALALWALDARRTRVVVACCVAGAFVKEDVALLFGTIALFGAARERRRGPRTAYLLLGGLLVAWTVALTKVVIPDLAGRPYAYWSYGSLGSGLDSILATVVRRPLLPLRLFVDRAAKVETLAALFGSFLFLPLLSPFVALALLPLAERLWNTNPNYWTLHYHYSLTIAPILAFAAVDALARLERRLPRRRLLALVPAGQLVVAAAVTAATLSSWPMAALGGAASAATERCLGAIPPAASVVATNGLVPHLSRRARIYTFLKLPHGYRPAVVAVAEAGGPRGARIVRRELAAGYRVGCRGGGTVVLTRAAA